MGRYKGRSVRWTAATENYPFKGLFSIACRIVRCWVFALLMAAHGAFAYEWWDTQPVRTVPPQVINSTWMIRNAAENAAAMILAAKRQPEPILARELSRKAGVLIDWVLSKQDAEGHWWTPASQLRGDPNVNRFVLMPLLDAILSAQAFPDLQVRLPGWRLAAIRAAEAQYSAFHGQTSWDWGGAVHQYYPNQDVYYLYICWAAANITSDAKFRMDEERTLEGLEQRQIPGGGWHYIASETESPIYHHIVELVLARYYEVTQNPRAYSLLESSVRYWAYAVDPDGLPDYVSDPWWKQFWKPIPRTALEIAASVSGDFYLKEVLRRGSDAYSEESPLTLEYGRYWRQHLAQGTSPQYGQVRFDPSGKRYFIRSSRSMVSVAMGRGLRNTFAGMFVRSDAGNGYAAVLRSVTPEVFVEDPEETSGDPLFLSSSADDVRVEAGSEQVDLAVAYEAQPPMINGIPAPAMKHTGVRVRQMWRVMRGTLIGALAIHVKPPVRTTSAQIRISLGPCEVIRLSRLSYRCGALLLNAFGTTTDPIVEKDRQQKPAMWPNWSSIAIKLDKRDMRPGSDELTIGLWARVVEEGSAQDVNVENELKELSEKFRHIGVDVTDTSDRRPGGEAPQVK